MNNRFTLQEMAGLLAEQTGRTKKDSEEFLRTLVHVISEGVFDDRLVKVKGLGTFKIVEVEDRESINVNTGKRIVIPGHYKFNFMPDKDLKELVNKPFSFFDTTEINNEEKLQELIATTEETIEDIVEENMEEPVETAPLPEPKPEEAEITIEEENQETIEPELPEEPEQEEVIERPQPPPVLDYPDVKSTPKKGNKTWLIVILILLVVAIAALAYYFIDPPKKYGGTLPEVASSTVTPPLDSVFEDEESFDEQEVVDEPIEQTNQQTEQTPENTQKTIGTVTIEPGSRLTLLALDYYGHKIFWVYIYEYNKNMIEDPNNIPVGTILQIPAPEVYQINAKDRASIERASVLQTQIISTEN